jgi:hypothetical protein
VLSLFRRFFAIARQRYEQLNLTPVNTVTQSAVAARLKV